MPCRVEKLWRQRDLAQQGVECKACIAQRTAHPDVVAFARAAAQLGLAGRRFAKDGDADIERSVGGVAAYQFAFMRVGQSPHAVSKRL